MMMMMMIRLTYIPDEIQMRMLGLGWRWDSKLPNEERPKLSLVLKEEIGRIVITWSRHYMKKKLDALL